MQRFAALSARAAATTATAWLAAARCDDEKRVFTIFLDVDGVLNSRATRDRGDAQTPNAPIASRHAPDRELVQTLSTLMREAEKKTGREGKIVLSSTWRLKPETTEAVE